jgi:predicted YcjX-like family ATPase
MALGDLFGGIWRGVTDPFGDPVLRLGVTGLARAGKTVFTTALVAGLMDRSRMVQLAGAGRITAAYLQPQPDLTLPRFDYEAHRAALSGATPRWPDSTRALSELRLTLRTEGGGFLGFGGARRLHIDILDYPGEWLLDLSLLDAGYAAWSEATLARLEGRAEARAFLALARAEDGALAFAEDKAQALAAAFTLYLQAARAAGWADCTPGRFLLPGDLAGSPVLTFAPLPRPADTPRGSLWREMARRFDGYRDRVAKPFFRDHFARIDRQVVLVDILGAIHRGPRAVEDLRRVMAEVMAAFRPGRSGWLSRLLGGARVERMLFAATKADHLHHSAHPRLTAIAEAMLREARDRAQVAGALTTAMSLAAWRSTTEEMRDHAGQEVPMVRGRLLDGRTVAMHAGTLPEDPARLLAPARDGAERWLEADYGIMDFAPPVLTLPPGEGPPHIRMDRALEFLIGDLL